MRTSKKLICIILSIIFVFGLFSQNSALALNENELELDVSYLNRAKCWSEAAKYVGLSRTQGLSRERIASEIYAHAVADNISYRVLEQQVKTYLESGMLVAGPGGMLLSFGTYYALRCVSDFLNDKSHIVTIGGDDWIREATYYLLWNCVDTPESGYYYSIHSKLDTSKAIDISGNSNDNGAKVQLWGQNKTSAQTFEFCPTGEGNWYNIVKHGSFSCLDVSGGIAGDCVKVQLYEYNGTAAQEWELYDAGDGYCYIRNRLGYFLDAAGGCSNDGTQIQTYTLNWTDAQKWRIDRELYIAR